MAENQNYNHKLVRAKNRTKNKKWTHARTRTVCCSSTKDRRPGVSHEGQHRVETAVRVARGEVSFCVTLGQTYYISIQDKLGVGFGIILGRTSYEYSYNTSMSILRERSSLPKFQFPFVEKLPNHRCRWLIFLVSLFGRG